MKKRKPKERFVDDGRVIADMNVPGMPWYNEASRKPEIKTGKEQELDLTKKEKRAMVGGVVAAALLVTVLFAGIFFLFILFCTQVWFK